MTVYRETKTTIRHRPHCPNCSGTGRIAVGLVTFRCQRCKQS